MITLGREGTQYYSIYKHLRDNLVASGIGSGGVSGTFIENYPSPEQQKTFAYPHQFINGQATIANNIGMPVIAFEDARSDYSDIELGTTNNRLNMQLAVSIFARDAQERMKLSNLMRHYLLDKSITKYDFSEFEVPTSDGNYYVNRSRFRSFPVKSTRSVDEQDPIPFNRHRHEIIFDIVDIR